MRNDPSLAERLSEKFDFDTDDDRSRIGFCQNHQPLLSVMLHLNQGKLEQLIEVLSNHFTNKIETIESCNPDDII